MRDNSLESLLIGRDRELSEEDLKRKNKSKYITSIVYSKAVLDNDGDMSNQERISAAYLKGVCELPTPNLELILQAHEDDLFKREDHTIAAIVDELARREIMEKE